MKTAMKAASTNTIRRRPPLLAVLALAAALSSTFGAGRALAQDGVVGREALDPGDQEKLPPAIDGRPDTSGAPTESIDGRTDSAADVDPRALEEFREPLAPYGAWVDDPTYGTIWVPDARAVGPDFTPYQTAGHWELTSDGDWLWVSDYAWGDIPFHYGRWVWVGSYGWGWVPGRVWAPAWVVWRTGPYGYVGWGPCPPTWGWYGGAAVWLWWPPPTAYWFVETRYVFGRHVHRHVIREPARVANAARQTTPLRRPASPSGGGLDAHRPARPDFDRMRYAGPRPGMRPVERHPEIGLDASRSRTSPGGISARGRGDATFGRPSGVSSVDRPSGPRGLTRDGARGGVPTSRPGTPPAEGGGPRTPHRDLRDADPTPPAREARPTPRGPSDDMPDRSPGRGISPARDVSPPTRGVGPRTSSPMAPSRPTTTPSKRRSTVAPSAPAPRGGGRVSAPRRGRR